MEIAKKVQKEVNKFPYKSSSKDEDMLNCPSDIIENQFVNCYSSALLGAEALLNEIGINYLYAHLYICKPGHTSTFLVTSDGKAYWQDFTPATEGGLNYLNYREINSELEEQVDFSDLINFPENGIYPQFKKESIFSTSFGSRRIIIFKPEIEFPNGALNNIGSILSSMDEIEGSYEARKLSVSINPESATAHNNLAQAYLNLYLKEESFEE